MISFFKKLFGVKTPSEPTTPGKSNAPQTTEFPFPVAQSASQTPVGHVSKKTAAKIKPVRKAKLPKA